MASPVVILAGGLATRMRPMTETIPKALLPVNGRPFADIQLGWLRSIGVQDVVFSIAHLGDSIREHVGDGSRFGLRVTYVSDGDAFLGTAGALRAVIDAGAVPDRFGVINGDSLLSLDLSAIEEAYARARCPALMTVMRNRNRWGASNVIYRDGRVTVYDKSRPERWRDQMDWIDYGYILLGRQAITDRVSPGQVADLAGLMRDLSAAGRLAGFEVTDRFYEVGSAQGLADLERHLGQGFRAECEQSPGPTT
jgi:NDP-sugar pyrophosphorylase family protein